MKKIVTLLLPMLLLALAAGAKEPLPRPTVDKRVELMGIVFRLAGAREYSQTNFKTYTDRIEAWFAPYKEHPVVEQARFLRKTRGVSYDAVMAMAVRLDDRLRLDPKKIDSTLDPRWDRAQLGEFAVALQKFVKETQFEQFFKQNQALYAQIIERFMPMFDRLDVSWYERFYGQKPTERYVVVLAPGNGQANYGASVDKPKGGRDVYAVIGVATVDSSAVPVFSEERYLSLLIHEFNHSFVNHLIEVHKEALRPSGERIMGVVGQHMASQAYPGWSTVLTESVVRAAVLRYMADHHFADRAYQQERVMQKTRSFVWIDPLADELARYDSLRSQYPTLESYMPRLVEAFDGMARYTETYDSLRRPHFMSIAEFAEHDTTVRADLGTITIRFDRPLVGRGYSLNPWQGQMPKINGVRYADDNRTVVFEVELKPNTRYGMVLLGLAFRTPDGDPIIPYIMEWKTAQ